MRIIAAGAPPLSKRHAAAHPRRHLVAHIVRLAAFVLIPTTCQITADAPDRAVTGCKLTMAAVARSPAACAPAQATRWPQIRPARPARGAAAREAKEEAPTATLPPPPAAVAATSPPATTAVDPADRKYLSLLPPFFSRATRLEEYGPGLWGLVQPLKLVRVGTSAQP